MVSIFWNLHIVGGSKTAISILFILETNNNEPGNIQELSREELLQLLALKNLRIKELESELTTKNNEIISLKSHLDKFQSVFPFSRHRTIGRKTGYKGIYRQRAQGISAEPQSETSITELLNSSTPKCEKSIK